MKTLFLVTALLQAGLIAFDEIHFHRRRGLPPWERLGHPIDTLTFLLPLGLLAFFAPTPLTETAYVALAAFSCLCITKDEWVHREICAPEENWVHSLLFVLHPSVLISGYASWSDPSPFLKPFFAAVAAFGLYQLFYWNVYANRAFPQRPIADQ